MPRSARAASHRWLRNLMRFFSRLGDGPFWGLLLVALPLMLLKPLLALPLVLLQTLLKLLLVPLLTLLKPLLLLRSNS